MSIVRVDNSVAGQWPASTAVSAGDRVVATDDSILVVFECTTAGTTGGTEPSWNTTPSATTSDGSAVWTARDIVDGGWSNPAGYIRQAMRAADPSNGDVVYVEADNHRESITGIWTITSHTNASRQYPGVIVTVDSADDSYKKTASGWHVDATSRMELTASFLVAYGLRVQGVHFYSTSSDKNCLCHLIDCDISNKSAGSWRAYDGLFLMEGGSIDWPDEGNGYLYTYYGTQENLELHGVTISGYHYGVGFIRRQTRDLVFRAYGCDFSGCINNSGGNWILLDQSGWSYTPHQIHLENCRMPSGWQVTDGSKVYVDQSVRTIGCTVDGASTAKRWEMYIEENYRGYVISDSSVYRADGWEDADDGDQLSWKFVTRSGEVSPNSALRGPLMRVWIDSTGSKTITVHGDEDFSTALQDDDVWMEVLYHSTANSMRKAVASTRSKPNESHSNLTAGTTWSPTTKTEFKLEVNVTVNQIGFLDVYVYVGAYESGKAVWICPKIEVS